MVKIVLNWFVDSGFIQYELGLVCDIICLCGCYVWLKDGMDLWFIIDFEDELYFDCYSV